MLLYQRPKKSYLSGQDCLELLRGLMSEQNMDAHTIARVDKTAEMKVTTDTTSVCALIPEGIFHTAASVLDSVWPVVEMNKQLLFCGFPSMQQHMNKSGLPNSTFEYPVSAKGCKTIKFWSVFRIFPQQLSICQ